jgi:hypothetical protein
VPKPLANFFPPLAGDVGVLIPILHTLFEALTCRTAFTLNSVRLLAD